MKTHIEINSQNLIHNLTQFHKLTNKPLMFVVKANAYGHGIEEVIDITRDLPFIGCYAVDAVEEALIIHRKAPGKKILVIGWADSDQLEKIILNDFEMVAPSLGYLEEVETVASRLNRTARVHLKIETGTMRMGMNPEDVLQMNQTSGWNPSPHVRVTGLYSHFANIEDTTDHSYAEKQLEIFHQLLNRVDHQGLVKHFSCSAATLLFPKTYFDIVRIGISAYGFWPSKPTYVSYIEQGKPRLELKPVLSWYSRVAQVKELTQGDSVGYGLTYRAFSDSRMIVVPVGYYDGYDRKLSNVSTILVNGIKAPVRGRICMNMFMAEVTHIPNVKPGDRVTLVGVEGNEKITVDHLADLAGTINYEMVARVNPLIPRFVV